MATATHGGGHGHGPRRPAWMNTWEYRVFAPLLALFIFILLLSMLANVFRPNNKKSYSTENIIRTDEIKTERRSIEIDGDEPVSDNMLIGANSNFTIHANKDIYLRLQSGKKVLVGSNDNFNLDPGDNPVKAWCVNPNEKDIVSFSYTSKN